VITSLMLSLAFSVSPILVDMDVVDDYVMYEYQYKWMESSPMVATLQYWMAYVYNDSDVGDMDGVYGQRTHVRHRQLAMERGRYIPTYQIVFPDKDFGSAVEQWRSTVRDAIVAFGGSLSDVPRFLRVMQCESNGDPDAYNSASGASGLMQHLSNYWDWRAKMAGFEGASPFDGVANIYTSAWLIYEHRAGGWQHWVCQ
jgi:hypothetical protein